MRDTRIQLKAANIPKWCAQRWQKSFTRHSKSRSCMTSRSPNILVSDPPPLSGTLRLIDTTSHPPPWSLEIANCTLRLCVLIVMKGKYYPPPTRIGWSKTWINSHPSPEGKYCLMCWRYSLNFIQWAESLRFRLIGDDLDSKIVIAQDVIKVRRKSWREVLRKI